jgi:hypothetical protein
LRRAPKKPRPHGRCGASTCLVQRLQLVGQTDSQVVADLVADTPSILALDSGDEAAREHYGTLAIIDESGAPA